MKKPPLPTFATDDEARAFVDTADLSTFDLSGGEMIRYEFQNKNANVHLRMPQQLLDDVKAEAARHGMPYQRFIRQTLETAIVGRKPTGARPPVR